MFWPTPQDYNEAVQLPEGNFSDDDLRRGRPELNALGLPKPISGSFASVYKIRSRGRDWAVKCFLNNLPDQHERYQHISDFVHHDDLPYTVDFEYLTDGIRIHGGWYPVLKMEWIEGEQLVDYVCNNLSHAYKLSLIADRFKEMLERMRSVQLAHADLQHGNILVVKDELRLVDYDGMYVPELCGFPSNELGHRNYQHPGRTKSTFGPYLDNFSAWVIYASLRILSLDTAVWNIVRPDGECLLFKQSDFQSPESSIAFMLLDHHDCAIVRNLSRRVHANCRKSVEEVPVLEGSDDDPVELPEPSAWQVGDTTSGTTISLSSRSDAGAQALPDWLAPDRAGPTAAVSMANAPAGVQVVDDMLKLITSPQLVAQTPTMTVLDSALELVSQPTTQPPAVSLSQGSGSGSAPSTGGSSANNASSWWNPGSGSSSIAASMPANAAGSVKTPPAASVSSSAPVVVQAAAPAAQLQNQTQHSIKQLASALLVLLGICAALCWFSVAMGVSLGLPTQSSYQSHAASQTHTSMYDKFVGWAEEYEKEGKPDSARVMYNRALPYAQEYGQFSKQLAVASLGVGRETNKCPYASPQMIDHAYGDLEVAVNAFNMLGDWRNSRSAEHERGINRYRAGDYVAAMRDFQDELKFWKDQPESEGSKLAIDAARGWLANAEFAARTGPQVNVSPAKTVTKPVGAPAKAPSAAPAKAPSAAPAKAPSAAPATAPFAAPATAPSAAPATAPSAAPAKASSAAPAKAPSATPNSRTPDTHAPHRHFRYFSGNGNTAFRSGVNLSIGT